MLVKTFIEIKLDNSTGMHSRSKLRFKNNMIEYLTILFATAVILRYFS